MDFAFHIISKESFVIQGCKFFPMFSSERVIVLGFMFRFLIYFELTVVYGVRYRPKFILMHVDVQLS